MIAALKGKTEYRAGELAAADGAFMEKIGAAGFADEAGFLSSRLDENERKTLEEREASLVREKRKSTPPGKTGKRPWRRSGQNS